MSSLAHLSVVAVFVTMLVIGVALRPNPAGRVVPVVSLPAADPRRRSRMGVRRALATVATIGAVVVMGPFLTVAVFGGIWVAARLRPALAERSHRRCVDRDLPDALDLLVLTVRAGLTPRQAMETLIDAAPPTIGPACAAVMHRTERGQSFADSLRALPDILGSSAIDVADAISSCERYGLPLGPLLDQITTETRAARRRLADADARKLPVRLSFPLVLCTLPSFVLLAIAPAVMAALSSLGASRP